MIRHTALAALMCMAAWAGCIDSDASEPDGGTVFQVMDEAGQPVAFAQIAVYAGDTVIALASTWYNGQATVTSPDADRFVIWAPGTQIVERTAGGDVTLEPGDETPPAPFLSFREPVPMPCDDLVWQAKQAVLDGPVAFMDLCGGGEPVLEVQSDGDIFLSTTVFLGSSPPLWKSSDSGATWSLYRAAGAGIARELTGTEVDMATDAAGNLYILDEQFATNWFTSIDGDDMHRWSHPFPMAPKTHDRPWVVAREADEVLIMYSDQHLRPRTTYQFRSADGGLTFGLEPEHEFPCAQMLSQGPTLDRLMLAGVLGCSGDAQGLDFDALYFRESLDFGLTWSAVEEAPLPALPDGATFSDRAMWVILNPVADEAGNTYIGFTHAVEADAMDVDIHLVRRSPDGTWAGPWRIGAPGTNMVPWIAAGQPGHVTVSWYHTDRPARQDAQDGAEWHIVSAVSIDADRPQGAPQFAVARADERPVFPGPGMFVTDEGLGRSGSFLADFTATEVLPDGSIGVAYSRSDVGQNSHAEPHFVRTDPMAFITEFTNGPQ